MNWSGVGPIRFTYSRRVAEASAGPTRGSV
jgi:hypothetical protein